jgi:hypothetical protein
VGNTRVDQIGSDGALVEDVDTRLSGRQKDDLLLSALPGATVERFADQSVIRFRDQIILKKQVTHLGHPWPGFKKRIQIPRSWIDVERQARRASLVVRFVGIYHYRDVTIFVDFDPTTYVLRKANNSAAHVATNDLFQAQTLGLFERTDRNGNRLTSVRSDLLAKYLSGTADAANPRIEVFRHFNSEFLSGERLEGLDSVKEMFAAGWPDRFQGEWPGFYLEFRLDAFLRRHDMHSLIEFQKVKLHGRYDYDLVFRNGAIVEHYGDLKASTTSRNEAPGNDAEDIRRCVEEFGRFWYIIYEHDTWLSRDNGDVATIAWNTWRWSVGHRPKKVLENLSYAKRYKEAVRFVNMKILEINAANFGVVLGDFRQGKQPDGAARALKVMINKKNIDNFLIYSKTLSEA